LKAIKGDKNLIFEASNKAQKAFELITNLKVIEEEEKEVEEKVA
jgi:hypothetical protein